MLLFNRPLGSRLTLPAIDDPPIHFCNSLSISQELCLRSSLERQPLTSTSVSPWPPAYQDSEARFHYAEDTCAVCFFNPPISRKANSSIFAVLQADLVRNVRDSKSLQRSVVRVLLVVVDLPTS